MNCFGWTREQNYFDMSHFAGEGNMGHIMEQDKAV